MDADAGHLTQVQKRLLCLAFVALPGYHGAVSDFGGIRSYPPISVLPPSRFLTTGRFFRRRQGGALTRILLHSLVSLIGLYSTLVFDPFSGDHRVVTRAIRKHGRVTKHPFSYESNS